MSSFRLHIDIPLSLLSEDNAAAISKRIVEILESGICKNIVVDGSLTQINYRLGNDEDRQKSNYLDKNENGHVSNKKTVIRLSSDKTPDDDDYFN